MFALKSWNQPWIRARVAIFTCCIADPSEDVGGDFSVPPRTVWLHAFFLD